MRNEKLGRHKKSEHKQDITVFFICTYCPFPISCHHCLVYTGSWLFFYFMWKFSSLKAMLSVIALYLVIKTVRGRLHEAGWPG